MNKHRNESTPGDHHRRQRVAILVTVVVVVAATLTGGLLLTRSGGGDRNTTVPPATQPTSTRVAVPTTSTGGPPGPTSATMTPGTTPTTQPAFSYMMLWPFASASEASEWQQSYRGGGHQPWHLGADLTALSFTQHYLGYVNVDKVIAIASAGREDWVTVGFDNPNHQPVISAVLHLARVGTDSDAPWEVVGTRDTTLSLTTPAYGSTVRSPVTVGGRITGVDESLRVQVRQLASDDVVGQVGGVPAGGDNSPWTATVPYVAPTHGVLTIAVSTGGHIADVERFAITGVRC